jgi:hypothetical protein
VRLNLRDRTIYLRADVLALLRELVERYAAAGILAPEAPLFVSYGRTNVGARAPIAVVMSPLGHASLTDDEPVRSVCGQASQAGKYLAL